MLITLPTYQRIYNVASRFLKQNGQRTQQACLFYSYCGAHILRQHYGHDAKVNCGIACYHLGIDKLLCFGEHANGKILATKNKFHAWVEVGEWSIDFMAPKFPDIMKAKGITLFIPSKMWQVELNKVSPDIDSMKDTGDFFLSRDNQLGRVNTTRAYRRPARSG